MGMLLNVATWECILDAEYLGIQMSAELAFYDLVNKGRNTEEDVLINED